MNEVIKVSISGIGFVFDKPAYEELKTYLDKLESGYKDNPDGREIIDDIEARIVEIILSRQPLEQVVEQSMVHETIEQLGLPDDLENAERLSPEVEDSKFPRRLYRNKDGAKLGGVCNGLATFFDTDPVWLRLCIFLPLILLIILPTLGVFKPMYGFLGSLFGSLVLLYVIMWAAVPLARTPRQKLEMRGKKITASSIQRSMSHDSTDMSEDAQKSATVFSKIFLILGQIILFGIKFVALTIGFAFGLAAIALLVTLVMAIIDPSVMVINNIGLTELQMLVTDFEYISLTGYIALLVAICLIPLVIIAYQIIRLVFGFRNNRALMWVLAGGWLLIVIYTGVVTARNADTIRNNAVERYSNLEFMREHIDLKDLGCIVINGDTVLMEGKVRRVDKLIDNLGTLKEIVLDARKGKNKVSINVNLDKDTTVQQIEISQITNDQKNGDN